MDLYRRPHRRMLDSGMPANDGERGRWASFDSSMVIILAALLCALVCALGINSLAKLILRCVGRTPGSEDEPPPSCGRRSLEKAALSRIPVAEFGSEGDEGAAFTECPICLSEFSVGEKIRVLPCCRHCFHVKCVDTWLNSRPSCPSCRRPVAQFAGVMAAFGMAGNSGDSATGAAVESV